jgi:hypothetical protein
MRGSEEQSRLGHKVKPVDEGVVRRIGAEDMIEVIFNS